MLEKRWHKQNLRLSLVSLILIGVLLAGCSDNSPTPTQTVKTAAPTASPISTSPISVSTFGVSATATVGSKTSATYTGTPSISETPPPGAVEGTEGRYYYIIDPILPFYKNNAWLGLPLGGMREARPDGYSWDGLYQNFQRGRVEAHRELEGKYSIELGLVNQELLKLKGQGR